MPDPQWLHYHILRTLRDHGPLWKQHVATRLHETEVDTCACSVQTIGRHIDQLRHDNYLETVVIRPDDINRDLIIAYQLTDQGHTHLQTLTDRLVREVLATWLCEDTSPVSTVTLRTLLTEAYPAISEILREKQDADGLLALLLTWTAFDQLADAGAEIHTVLNQLRTRHNQ